MIAQSATEDLAVLSPVRDLKSKLCGGEVSIVEVGL
jgi:hypothetical protein